MGRGNYCGEGKLQWREKIIVDMGNYSIGYRKTDGLDFVITLAKEVPP